MYYIIYETTNLINGKKYRGMHQTEKLDDGYLGSGFLFKKALKKYGEENFSREILKFCESYNELIQAEKIYVNMEWVNDGMTYNLKTGGQSEGILCDASKKKLSYTLTKKYETGEIIKRHVIPYQMTDEIIKKISDTLKRRYANGELVNANKGKPSVGVPWKTGHLPWCTGLKLGPMSDEEKEKRSKTMIEWHKNNVSPSKGKDPWNKGKKGAQIAWNKGKQMKKHECPHCGKLVDILNLKKWHLDNCKLNSNK